MAGTARACYCAGASPTQAFKAADAAIVGELVEIVPLGEERADFRYRVRAVYKGRQAIGGVKVLSVLAPMPSVACGLPRQEGRQYGLLLSENNGRWWGGRCGVLDPRTLRSAAQSSTESRKRVSIGDAFSCSG